MGAALISTGGLDASAIVSAEAPSKKAPPKAPKEEKQKEKAPEFVKLENGLAYQNKKVNTGALSGVEMKVGEGSFVIIDYIAYMRDGTIFDNTVKRGKPVAFQVLLAFLHALSPRISYLSNPQLLSTPPTQHMQSHHNAPVLSRNHCALRPQFHLST